MSTAESRKKSAAIWEGRRNIPTARQAEYQEWRDGHREAALKSIRKPSPLPSVQKTCKHDFDEEDTCSTCGVRRERSRYGGYIYK